jgi:hypothetical protein
MQVFTEQNPQALEESDLTSSLVSGSKLISDILALPFDISRELYAFAVRSGIIEKSLLASARFGKTLNAMEKLTLGPWARSV